MYVLEAKCEFEFPFWVRRGGCATKKMVPFLIGARGVVRNGAKHLLTTPPFAKKRENGTPPNLGGDFPAIMARRYVLIRSNFTRFPPRIASFAALFKKDALSTKSMPTGQSNG